MQTEESQFIEYVAGLRARVNDHCIEATDNEFEVAPVAFHEEGFTAVMLEILEDLGQVANAEVCYFDRKIGRAIGKVNAWGVDEEAAQVELVTTVYRGGDTPGSVTGTELTQAVQRAVRVFLEAGQRYHERMEPASPAFDMMERLCQVYDSTRRLRVIVLADGLAADITPEPAGAHFEVVADVWDLRRVYRADSSGLPYEPIHIDIEQRMGAPLPCLPMPASSADYDCYLAILPGSLLHSIYHEYGARLLELNVRSFLQARGKVNRGIRDTLKGEPARFLAYNNGISATAEQVELVGNGDGGLAIRAVKGLQVVNGGQTVASIHRACERDGVALDDVFVQAKITIVQPEHIETLVPLVSRYANTQNRVNEADFSANHPFHVRIQQLSNNVWAPGEQSRWFYERARGQYQVAKAREGTTPARLRRFNAANPTSQKFDKVLLAKYVNAWDQLPHVVSRGGQKNFVAFMDRLARQHARDWEPDAAYYKHLVAKAIIFKQAERSARLHHFPGYRANAVAYTVALVSYRTAGRVDLDAIWNAQALSQALKDTIHEWMAEIYDEIVESAGGRNVTEWAKKEDCWRHIQTIDVEVGRELQGELAEGQALPTVGSVAGRKGINLSDEDRENIARVMQVEPEEWIHISGWGARTRSLPDWQAGIAATLASYAAGNWSRVPSAKQARQGVAILLAADDGGGRLYGEEG